MAETNEQLVKEIERLETLAGEWGENAKGWEAAYNKLKAETTAEIERLRRRVADVCLEAEFVVMVHAERDRLRQQVSDLEGFIRDRLKMDVTAVAQAPAAKGADGR